MSLVGTVYEMLTVIYQESGQVVCRCECGTYRRANTGHFNAGGIKSCGCHKPHHGQSGTRAAISYNNMIARCHNPKNKRYKDYGARGIVVCDRWRESSTAFHEDMGPCPDGYTLDRIDNTKGYSPDNCRWATRSENQRNRSVSKRWFVRGEVFGSSIEAGQKLGVSSATIKAWCEGRLAEGRWYPAKQDCWTEPLYDTI